MLTAHANTTAEDFLVQLRTFVIAMGLSPMVVDCVDNLIGIDELENQHAANLEEAESGAELRGRESMKTEILGALNAWLENQENYDLIAAPCEAMIKEIEGVDI